MKRADRNVTETFGPGPYGQTFPFSVKRKFSKRGSRTEKRNNMDPVQHAPPTVHRYKMKVAPYCSNCETFNFLLLAGPGKKAAEATKERTVLVFVWDRLNELTTYMNAHGTAYTEQLDAFIADSLASGALLAFGTLTSASDLLYANASNGSTWFVPSPDGVDGLYGTVNDFLGRFSRTNAFFAGATKKPHSTTAGWSIALNTYTYAKFRTVLGLPADCVLGRKHNKPSPEKKQQQSPERPAPTKKRLSDDDMRPLPPTQKKATTKKSVVAASRTNEDDVVMMMPKPQDDFVPLDDLWKKREPYKPIYPDTIEPYTWPVRREPGDFALFTKVGQPPMLTRYDPVEHSRCVAYYMQLNAQSPNPRPAVEVELMATNYIFAQWSAIPPDQNFLRAWVNFLGKYRDSIVRTK